METDSKHVMRTETGDQNGDTSATPPHTKPNVTKPVIAGKAAKKKSTSKRMEPTALQKEQRKAAAAQAAVEDLQRRLAAVEEALAEERQKAAAAQQALAEQRQAAVAPPRSLKLQRSRCRLRRLPSVSCPLLVFVAWIFTTLVSSSPSRR